MFKVLIVDDNMLRAKMLKNHIENETFDDVVLVENEYEKRSTINRLQKEQFDLLIIDIQLPSIDCNSGVDVHAGISLLDMIANTDRLKKPIQVIGITAYDEHYEEVEEELKKKLCLLLKYDGCSEDWIKAIKIKLRFQIAAKKNLIEAFFNDYEFDCAIITAVDIEMKAVLKCGLEWKKVKSYDGINYFYSTTTDSGLRIIAVQQTQMGMVGAASSCNLTISYFKPKIVAMVGIAAGKKGRVNIGDIIVAESSWDYGSGKMEKNEEKFVLLPDPHYINIDPHIKAVFSHVDEDLIRELQTICESKSNVKLPSNSAIHVGALPSGTAVIQTEDLITDFIEPHNRKMLGIDMETYAVYFSAQNSSCSPKFVSIKTVSDYANCDKNDDYQNYAAYMSILVLLKCLDNLLVQ